MPIARFFSVKDDTLFCDLCPRRCSFKTGMNEGCCSVRIAKRNKDKLELEIPYYGCITALAMDRIEKKPLYHWRPGSYIASVGFAGCNLKCPFCQNWHISQIENKEIERMARHRFSPRELIEAVIASFSQNATTAREMQIAYTYSEPLIHAEYLLDCMALARRQGIANVLVTNGCVNTKAAEEILLLTDAANIDLKCFSKETYANVLKGNLDTVLDFIRASVRRGVHTEITTLVVPGLNDSEEELTQIARFIAGLDKEIPWHLTAYHPCWKHTAPPTNPDFLKGMAKKMRGMVRYVYTGNV